MEADKFHSGLLHPKYWPTWLGVGLVGLFSCLPAAWRRAALAPIGRKAIFNNQRRLRVVKANIDLCFPELSHVEKSKLLKQHAEHAGFALGEIAWAWFRPLKRIKRRTEIEGIEHLRNAEESGRPIILMVPHMLYLDYVVMSITHETPCAGIFNSFKNPVIDWLVALKRGGSARYSATLHKDPTIDDRLTLIRRQDGGTIEQIITRAKQGFAIVHLMDEDLGAKHSVFAPMFGTEKASLASTSHILQETNALVLPLTVRYDKITNKYLLHMDEALDLQHCYADKVAVASAVNKAYEKLIRFAPEQYMWNLRIFRNRPEGDDRTIYKGELDWN